MIAADGHGGEQTRGAAASGFNQAGTARTVGAANGGGGEGAGGSTVGIDALSSIFSQFFGGALGGGARMSRVELAAARRARRRRYLQSLQAMETNSLTVLSAYLSRTEAHSELAQPHRMLADETLSPAQAESLGLNRVPMGELTRAALAIIDARITARDTDFLTEVETLGGGSARLSSEARERLSQMFEAARKDAAKVEASIQDALQRLDEQDAAADQESSAAATHGATAAQGGRSQGGTADAPTDGDRSAAAADASGAAATLEPAVPAAAEAPPAQQASAGALPPPAGTSTAQQPPDAGTTEAAQATSQDGQAPGRQRGSQRGSRSGRASGRRGRRARYEYMPLVLVAYSFLMERAQATMERYNAAMQGAMGSMRQALFSELGGAAAPTFEQTQVP